MSCADLPVLHLLTSVETDQESLQPTQMHRPGFATAKSSGRAWKASVKQHLHAHLRCSFALMSRHPLNVQFIALLVKKDSPHPEAEGQCHTEFMSDLYSGLQVFNVPWLGQAGGGFLDPG